MTSKIEGWLASLPEEDVMAELHDLEGQLRELERQVALRREVLAMKRRWAADETSSEVEGPAVDSNGSGPTVGTAVSPDEDPDDGDVKRGKDAVLAVMREAPDRAWSLDAILDAWESRTWIEDREGSRHSLQVAASRMFRRKELKRMRPGVYRLALHMKEGGEQT